VETHACTISVIPSGTETENGSAAEVTGVASEEVRDLAAWVDFTEAQGCKRVVLVGHSAGWAAVRRYQAEKQDSRVVGVVLASGAVRADTRPPDPDQLAEAKRLMALGEPDALIRDPKRSFPSYISTATFLDIVNTPPEFKDFFGVQPETSNPGLMNGDVGNEAELELLKSSIQRQRSGPRRVDTVMIRNADHMYTGEEAQVAHTIAAWIDTVALPQPGTSGSKR